MRKIIVLSFITLDGVMQAPGGPEEDPIGGFTSGGWTVPYFDDFLGQTMTEQMSRPFDLLLGRKTYEIFAAYWPHHNDEGAGLNKATKYVASHAPIELTWEHSVLLRAVVENIPDHAGHGQALVCRRHHCGSLYLARSDNVAARRHRRLVRPCRRSTNRIVCLIVHDEAKTPVKLSRARAQTHPSLRVSFSWPSSLEACRLGRSQSRSLPSQGHTDASKDMLLAAKDRRIKQLEEENRRLQKELKVALGKQYEQL